MSFSKQRYNLKVKWHILIIYMFVWVALKAQGLNDWKTITYMNDITDMVYSGDEVWVSTTGGIYKFFPGDNSPNTLLKSHFPVEYCATNLLLID